MKFALALALATPLFSQCTAYVVTPLSFKISADATPGSILVTQTPGSTCGDFRATTLVPWLHINEPAGGPPGTTVTFTADANLGAAPRSGVITIALQTVTVEQAGANCSFTMSPTGQSFPVGGGDSTFLVTANCVWSAAPSANWIALKVNGTSGVPIGYTVAANTCVAARSGTITLLQTNLPKPPTLAVAQDGSPDNISISPSSATVGAAASDGRLGVTTGDVCNWSASADVSWIRITAGASGTGNGGVSYHLLENTTAQRSGSIHVGPLTYTITQLAPAAPPVLLSTVTNAANYNADAVSPGEIVALFGANMGPDKIVTLQVNNGTVTNLLAGTQVLFDGVAAPMVYTLKGQVSAVVPYGVAGKDNTKVQVSYQGALSNTLNVPVHAATPAIFSLDSTGIGPGAILNQDLSTNSTGNPAARLSIIALYCTGGGVTTPATSDGAVIGVPPPVLSQAPVVTVTIGGVNAAVKFAGAAPFAVAGLTQINVEVPAALAPSLALPVIVKIGDFASTGSVTVAVK